MTSYLFIVCGIIVFLFETLFLINVVRAYKTFDGLLMQKGRLFGIVGWIFIQVMCLLVFFGKVSELNGNIRMIFYAEDAIYSILFIPEVIEYIGCRTSDKNGEK